MTSDPLGDFCDSGLPEFLQGSWENAKTILKLNGISRHPTDEQKYVVISLSQPIVHTINVKPTGAIACDKECYRFKTHRICAHTISVAKMLDILDFLISHYNPDIEQAVLSTMPKESGKKPGQQTRKRKSQPARDTRGWDDIESTQTNSESSNYRVVFVRSTKATTCYGCGGKVRDKPSSDPPPAPYDIFLCRYECRVYRKKGRFSQSTTLNITTQEEAVYYHPVQKCLSQKFGEGNSDNILVSDNVKSQLLDCHHQILLREFGLRVNG